MIVLPKRSINLNSTTSNIAVNGTGSSRNNQRSKHISQVMSTQVSGFHNQARKNSMVASKYASNPIGPREPNQIRAVQKPGQGEDMEDDQRDTIDEDELIDHNLLKKIPDNASSGSNEYKKLTSRRLSG